MTKASAIAASLALLTLAMSPVAAELAPPYERTLVAKLCGGGEIRIPIGSPDKEREDHCPDGKACHAGACRKQFDPGQRPERG